MSDEYTLCPNCRDRYMPPGSAMCHACREQEVIDAEAWLDDPDFKGYGIPDDDEETMEDMYPLELDDEETLTPCPRCNGTGQNRYDLTPCEFCDGEGYECF